MWRVRVLGLGLLILSVTLVSHFLCTARFYRAAACVVRAGMALSGEFRSDFRVSLASIHDQMGRRDEAIAELTELAEREPDNALCFFELGVIHEESGQNDLAARNFERLLDLTPDASQEFRAHLADKIAQLKRGQPGDHLSTT